MASKNSVLQHFNKSLTLACMLIAVSTFNYGFDNAGFNTTQAMDGFQQQFGRYNSAKERVNLTARFVHESRPLAEFVHPIGVGGGLGPLEQSHLLEPVQAP